MFKLVLRADFRHYDPQAGDRSDVYDFWNYIFGGVLLFEGRNAGNTQLGKGKNILGIHSSKRINSFSTLT